MSKYTVYGFPLSPFVRKVEAFLRNQGVDYDFENVNIMAMPDWFLEISPARRIPVLRDKTVGEEGVTGTIADSSAICLYLEKELDAGLYGANNFDMARIMFVEEYADTEVAMPLGLQIFRPIIFPLFQGKESDIETAKKGWNEVLPQRFDYLEKALDGRDYFVGDSFSMADIAVGSQMTQLDLVVGTPDAAKWPGLVKHIQAMKARSEFAANLEASSALLGKILPEKVDLSA